jgi:beta-phosphoglucomutase
MKTQLPYKAFLLDNDGVICDSNKYHWEGYRDIIKNYYPEIEYTQEEHNTLLGINTYDTFVAILKNHGYGTQVNNKEIIETIKIMEKTKQEDFQTRCEHSTPEVLFDGMRQFLKSAHEAGIILIVCSSSSSARTMLENAKVIDYINYVVNPKALHDCLTPLSIELGKIPGKPAPDLFETGFIRAAQFLPNLKKEQVLGFEDATNGVAAIKRAGISALYIGDITHPSNKKAFEEQYKVMPDYVVEHSSQITLNKVTQLVEEKNLAIEQ